MSAGASAPSCYHGRMIRSMSGHGRGEAASEHHRVVVEVRSVNHRFCPISLRLPAELSALEEAVRGAVRAAVQRGKVDLAVSVGGGGNASVAIDADAAAGWAGQLHELAERAGLAAPTIQDVLPLPGVMVDPASGIDAETDRALVMDALESALRSLDEFRQREGRHLAADLAERVASIREGVKKIEAVASDLPARVRDNLRQKISELLTEIGAEPDPDRVAQEAAYSAERADITEELVRLRSHLDKLDRLLGADEPVGRTLEFLAQEIHRELSTIGAKTKELGISDTALDLKAELERIREQVQNIE